jgi:hypothetical protein
LDIPKIFFREDVTLWADSSNSSLAGVGGSIKLAKLTSPGESGHALLGGIAQAGWTVIQDDGAPAEVNSTPISLVIEAGQPIPPEITENDWAGLQELLTSGAPVLWVTEGSQLGASDPHKALIHGLRRTAHAEDPSLELIIVDVERINGPYTLPAVLDVLRRFQAGKLKGTAETGADFEFSERQGVI